MDKKCENCKHCGLETVADVGACNCCEDFDFYSPHSDSDKTAKGESIPGKLK